MPALLIKLQNTLEQTEEYNLISPTSSYDDFFLLNRNDSYAFKKQCIISD